MLATGPNPHLGARKQNSPQEDEATLDKQSAGRTGSDCLLVPMQTQLQNDLDIAQRQLFRHLGRANADDQQHNDHLTFFAGALDTSRMSYPAPVMRHAG